MNGRIIILNGTSSAGKTTLARALRPQLPTSFCYHSSDQLADAKFRPIDPAARSAGREHFFVGFHRTIPALASAGLDLLVEHIVEEQQWAEDLASLLKGFDVFWVGVHASIDLITAREKQRGDRTIGEALYHLRTHSFCRYDVEVDTSQPSAALTETIVQMWEGRKQMTVTDPSCPQTLPVPGQIHGRSAASLQNDEHSDVIVCRLQPEDEAGWLGLRKDLWPDSDETEAREWDGREDAATLVAKRPGQNGLIGFVEVGSRPYADGYETSPVAFIEGWYVDVPHRGAGVGARLIHAASLWAQDRGLKELASDSLLENTKALLAHLGAGFEEVERSIKYRLLLGDCS